MDQGRTTYVKGKEEELKTILYQNTIREFERQRMRVREVVARQFRGEQACFTCFVFYLNLEDGRILRIRNFLC